MSNITNYDMESLYIPYVNPSVIFNIYGFDKYKSFNYIYNNVDNQFVEMFIIDFIKKQFKYQKVGIINRVDLVRKFNKTNNLPYYSAFCHFEKWYEHEVANKILANINQKNIMYYEENSYWILYKNKNPLSQKHAILHRTIHDQLYYINNIMKRQLYISPLGKSYEELVHYVYYLQCLIV